MFPDEQSSKKNLKEQTAPDAQPTLNPSTPSPITTTQEKDSDNSFGEAQEISYETTILGEIANNEDKDYFKIANLVPKRDWLKVTLTNQSMTLSPLIRIYDQKKNWVTSGDNGTPGGDLELFFVAEPGED